MSCRVKICGLTRLEDAEAALGFGADALGFVLEPSSPRCLPDDKQDIALGLGPLVQTFAVYGPLPAELATGFGAIQFSEGRVPATETRQLLKAIRIKPEDTLEVLLAQLEGLSWAMVKAYSSQGYGGTGTLTDWGIAAELVQAAKIPIVLAGGLSPNNVAEAVRKVRPYGVDVSSGVEAQKGIKDLAMVRDFIAAAKGA